MLDLTFGWGEILGKVASIVNTKIARRRADEYSNLEKECLEEFLKHESRNDVKYVRLRAELKLARDAFHRDLDARDIEE